MCVLHPLSQHVSTTYLHSFILLNGICDAGKDNEAKTFFDAYTSLEPTPVGWLVRWSLTLTLLDFHCVWQTLFVSLGRRPRGVIYLWPTAFRLRFLQMCTLLTNLLNFESLLNLQIVQFFCTADTSGCFVFSPATQICQRRSPGFLDTELTKLLDIVLAYQM